MMTNYYERIKRFINKNPHLVLPLHGIPATDEMVLQLEGNLGLKLKGEYLQFIQTWGSLLLAGFIERYEAIYSWNDKEIFWVLNESQFCWEKKGLDRKLIPILSIEGDAHYCLDPSIDGNQSVYLWDTHFNKIIEKLSDSLFELIWREIEKNVIPNAMKGGKQVNL